ncbi:bifunctional diguanylate cyclase/phosphodiesterase [Paenibacillus sp. J22TS3]|uniref:putative bifunctional diguanylate cyclase/phosphodiesterase n=1 Tax=Paenibacillus sp. J22TS3 TaxID=2807192 RepID=UPI001B0A5746|nr:bifunctional diguanylate cyclase/phosphodiesterase [Paenibacillus sp. J22TS3]GIP21978.1 hypothetical protein J22TS3_22530 [Paenibacillus sp. J22TS3]
MNILLYSIVIDLVPFLFLYYMAIEIFLRQPKNRLHQLTMVLTLSLGLIFLFDFLIFQVPLGSLADEVGSLKYAVTFPTMALALYFFHYISRLKLHPTLKHMACLAPMLGLIFIFIPDSGIPAVMIQEFNEGRVAEFNDLFRIVLLSLIVYTLLVLLLMIAVSYRKLHSNKQLVQERYRIQVILIGSLITVVSLIVLSSLNFLLRTNELYVFDFLPSYCVFPWIIAIRYSMVRFDFLASAGRRYELLFKNSYNGIALLNERGEIVETNKAFRELLGANHTSLLGIHFTELMREEQALSFAENYEQHFNTLKPGQEEFELKHVDGTYKQVEVYSDYLESGGQMLAFLVTQDISRQKNTERELTEMAYQDTLTGLGNLRLLRDKLATTLETLQHDSKVALILLDLDQFKWINDTLGHSSGDLMLQQVADSLKARLPDSCVITRLGGDEFAIMIEGLQENDDAMNYSDALMDIFKKPFVIDNKLYTVTASIGVSIAPRDGSQINVLLQNADMAMFEAKKAGRNQIYMFNSQLQEKADRNLAVYNGLFKALEQNELTLHYQPQIDLSTRRVHGVEALLRWNSHELGPVSPAEFIPVAEDTGLIVPIGAWVLRTAIIQAKSWVDMGYRDFVVSVNISAQQLRDQQFAFHVIDLLRQFDLPARNLCLEITESTAIMDLEASLRLCGELNDLGITLALDDFGVGYSSLSMLSNLPLHYLKIDRSLITNIAVSKRDAAVVGTIIELSNNLDMQVVAEGIETTDQLRILEQLGCHEVQGYLFGKPMPAAELTLFLEGRSK